MEGHGVWRTGQTFCQPGVAYQRGDLLCVCNELGYWPNPTCRETFRVLHQVEVVDDLKVSAKQNCLPNKLYLVECNVCLCPTTGFLDFNYCTKKICSKTDPVFKQSNESKEVAEVYAQCDPDKKYKLGCKSCVCLRNNRLLCDNCTKVSQCMDKVVGESFEMDCNTCHCDKNGMLFCTVKKCLSKQIETDKIGDQFQLSITPDHDLDCMPGTKYLKKCNTCFCYLKNGITKFTCTMKQCDKSSEVNDCVAGNTYGVDCLICHCAIENGVKVQTCQADPKCYLSSTRSIKSFPELDSLNGYCEPLHIYKHDCNTCQCLQDGKAVKCTSEDCGVSAPKPVNVDLVPVIQQLTTCPKGQSYKIDCNFCFCLANGNAICTTRECNQRKSMKSKRVRRRRQNFVRR